MCSGYKDLVTTGALQHIPLQHCRAPADTTQQNTQHTARSNKKWRQNTNLIIRLKVLETDQSALQCLVVVVPAAVCCPNILISYPHPCYSFGEKNSTNLMLGCRSWNSDGVQGTPLSWLISNIWLCTDLS